MPSNLEAYGNTCFPHFQWIRHLWHNNWMVWDQCFSRTCSRLEIGLGGNISQGHSLGCQKISVLFTRVVQLRTSPTCDATLTYALDCQQCISLLSSERVIRGWRLRDGVERRRGSNRINGKHLKGCVTIQKSSTRSEHWNNRRDIVSLFLEGNLANAISCHWYLRRLVPGPI